MSMKRKMAMVVAAIFSMTLAGGAMAATKTQTQIKTPTTTTCTPKLDGSGK